MSITKLYRKVAFTNAPLKTSFRFEDKFQVVPFDFEGKPYSPMVRHFPFFLEYNIEFENDEPNDIFELSSIRSNKEKEILNILSCLTNHRFFSYDSSFTGWGFPCPSKTVDEMSEEERNALSLLQSKWFMGSYIYHGLKKDLEIKEFTDYKPAAELVESRMHEYYMDNPVDDYEHVVTFPNTLPSALHFYYELTDKTRRIVNSCIYLACDGMDIVSHKRSLAFLSYVSAIEGLIGLEVDDKEIEFECNSCKTIKSSPYICPKCGRPIWGIKQKFISFLAQFVAGSEKSQDIYKKVYNLRCKITHTGKLFLGDYELSFDENNTKQEGEDWLMRLKTLQLFRISLESWLRYPNKKHK